jgi:hypothetical protein
LACFLFSLILSGVHSYNQTKNLAQPTKRTKQKTTLLGGWLRADQINQHDVENKKNYTLQMMEDSDRGAPIWHPCVSYEPMLAGSFGGQAHIFIRFVVHVALIWII